VLKIRVELKGAASVVHSLKYCDVTISCTDETNTSTQQERGKNQTIDLYPYHPVYSS